MSLVCQKRKQDGPSDATYRSHQPLPCRAAVRGLFKPTARYMELRRRPGTSQSSPDQAYPELFEAVQREQVFPDQKHFVDALPNRDPAQIRADYLARRNSDAFDIKAFVKDNFIESGAAESPAPKPGAPIEEHIDSLWPILSRTYKQVPAYSSLLPLPQPYVVPGGRFREMYYWDSYFTMLGLEQSGDKAQVRQMTDNFAYMIDTYGHIPNGNRTYYLSRSQPPFFAYMVQLQARIEGDQAYGRYLPQLQKEYAYWMEGAQALKPGAAERHVVKLADGSVLNRYWDASATPRQESWLQDVSTAEQAPDRPKEELWRDLRAGAESGWDFSSRWLDDGQNLASIRTTAIVPVDLNSLIYHLENTIAKACETVQNTLASRLTAGAPNCASVPSRSTCGMPTKASTWTTTGNATSSASSSRPRRCSRCIRAWRLSSMPIAPPMRYAMACCAPAASPPPRSAMASSGTSPMAGHRCNGWRWRVGPIPAYRPGAANWQPLLAASRKPLPQGEQAGGEIRSVRSR